MYVLHVRHPLTSYVNVLGPPIIRDNDALKKEIELLESLSDMKETAAMLKSGLKDDSGVHALDKQFQSLGMNEMSPLDHKSREFTEIDEYLNNSKGKTHSVSYQVQEIFRIERKGEFERFDKSKYAKIASNRRLLWHGSRVTNYGGILGQGLRIAPPEAPVSGYMFGKGIYLADMSSKSANYCCSYNSGGTALLLLCEAEMGNPMHELTDSSYSAGEDALKKGMYSTFGKGQTGPSKWKDAACMNPALAGCMMVSTSTVHYHCHIASQANQFTSPTYRYNLVPPMFLAPIYNTTNTLRTMSPRSSFATYFVSACSIVILRYLASRSIPGLAAVLVLFLSGDQVSSSSSVFDMMGSFKKAMGLHMQPLSDLSRSSAMIPSYLQSSLWLSVM
jgi:hypothetical protein